jgi:ureidoacrylate peracid hydrolase
MGVDIRRLRINAEPDPVDVDIRHAGAVVVDMQNGFLKQGGMWDLAGIDLTQAPSVITMARRALTAVRGAGIPVIYLQAGYPPDLSTAGGPESPHPQKSPGFRMIRDRPDLRTQQLIFGEWAAEIVDELKPEPGDIVVRKPRYNGFVSTHLDSLLRGRGIRALFVMGVATNVCVESTVRDAYFREYWPIVIGDATMQEGPEMIQEATLFNIRKFFGWVTTSGQLVQSLSSAS